MTQTPQAWRVDDYDQWREVARSLLNEQVTPDAVYWENSEQQQSLLSALTVEDLRGTDRTGAKATIRVPGEFLTLAERVACHTDRARWSLLYNALWRIAHGERHLLELSSDDITRSLLRMEKQITRDCHKMKAFVRFTKVSDEPRESFAAWYKPDHNVLKLVAPFFARRFKAMDWSILTPFASAHWDGAHLDYGPGVDSTHVPNDDELVRLWRDYYRSVFNPARIKVKAMKREMPVRFWDYLPEAAEIDELLREAPERVTKMHARSREMLRSAEPFIPKYPTLASVSEALKSCEGCDLCRNGTRAVPGIGPEDAKLIIVGEQPGDVEEQQGIPFVGPAGELLNRLLAEASLDRSQVYVTNVVKHFHHQMRGKRRLHQRPSARHEVACKPWFETEVAIIRPKYVLGLGVTALHALLGRQHTLGEVIGTVHQSWASDHTYFAWHPASILRSPEPLARKREEELRNALIEVNNAMMIP